MGVNLDLSGWYATFETRLTAPDPLTGVTGWQDSTKEEILQFCERRGWRLDAMLDVTEGGADGCALVTIDERTYKRLLKSGLVIDEFVSDDLHCLVTIERPS